MRCGWSETLEGVLPITLTCLPFRIPLLPNGQPFTLAMKKQNPNAVQAEPNRRDFLVHSAVGVASLGAVMLTQDTLLYAMQGTSSSNSERTANMAKIKGTETEKNLLKAFAGESQARNRYTFFASQAKKEGYEQIASLFEETANQEKEHAKRFFNFLEGGVLEITAAFPAGMVLTTAENLKGAAAGEHEEWNILYPKFAEIAKEEGFRDVAAAFTSIAIAEKQHEKRYVGLLAALENGNFFERKNEQLWYCRNCGFVTSKPTLAAPQVCPACQHPQAWFEILKENW